MVNYKCCRAANDVFSGGDACATPVYLLRLHTWITPDMPHVWRCIIHRCRINLWSRRTADGIRSDLCKRVRRRIFPCVYIAALWFGLCGKLSWCCELLGFKPFNRKRSCKQGKTASCCLTERETTVNTAADGSQTAARVYVFRDKCCRFIFHLQVSIIVSVWCLAPTFCCSTSGITTERKCVFLLSVHQHVSSCFMSTLSAQLRSLQADFSVSGFLISSQ